MKRDLTLVECLAAAGACEHRARELTDLFEQRTEWVHEEARLLLDVAEILKGES